MTSITEQRAEDYGDPRDTFDRVAAIWTGITGYQFCAEDIPLMMIGLKIAREQAKHKYDNLVDIAGYADCLRIMEDGNSEKPVCYTTPTEGNEDE